MHKDLDQWGNIELPGLSDEELFRKNWNLVAANRQVAKDRLKNGWLEKNREAIKNRPEGYGKKISETSKKLRADTTWKEGFIKTIEKRNNDPEYRQRLKQGIEKRNSDPAWIEANLQAQKKKWKKIQTPEGLFDSVKDAILHYNKIKQCKNSENWLRDQRKKYPNEYFLIKE